MELQRDTGKIKAIRRCPPPARHARQMQTLLGLAPDVKRDAKSWGYGGSR